MVWEQIAFIANSVMFFAAGTLLFHGLFVASSMAFESRNWGYLVLTYVFIHCIRAIAILPLLAFSYHRRKQNRVECVMPCVGQAPALRVLLPRALDAAPAPFADAVGGVGGGGGHLVQAAG